MSEKYIPFIPRNLGIKVIENISLETLVRYIDWRFFFSAWKLTGNYKGIEKLCDCTACTIVWLQQFTTENQPKAKEALQLYQDARALLGEIKDKKLLTVQGMVNLLPAISKDEGIIFQTPSGKEIYLPALRQQTPAKDEIYYSLSDFISPKNDYAGAFAVTVHGVDKMLQNVENKNDNYKALLIKSLADRLAEAAAEWLHEQIRKQIWGYTADENLSIDDMLRVRYTGIRPAIGYPSLPDMSLIFDFQDILPLQKIGIKLTENGAMIPNASVCGILIAHPKARYFAIGKIDTQQLEDYAHKRKKSPQEMRKWLAGNI